MIKPILTFYSSDIVAHIGAHISPSSVKPEFIANALISNNIPVSFIEPHPVTVDDFNLAHDPEFVRDILSGARENGFGNKSLDVSRSLPYTSGAMLGAARAALYGRGPCAALVSGFHHAGYANEEGFCTFNGLMVTAMVLLKNLEASKIAIIDADYHYGNGTDNIITKLGVTNSIFHYSFGHDFHSPLDADAYLEKMKSLRGDLKQFKPDVILYQAGADAHEYDPLGGVLSTHGLYERDLTMFKIADELRIPICWDLAGGYQRDADGGISVVTEIHLNTFKASLVVQTLKQPFTTKVLSGFSRLMGR
jgi:acetoin utilization deacetylase AcuC-like enzyme